MNLKVFYDTATLGVHEHFQGSPDDYFDAYKPAGCRVVARARLPSPKRMPLRVTALV